jgi:DNA-binding Xre family transcriptional regulator
MIINRLPELLEQKEISIRTLAKDTGVTYSTIWAMVHSRRRSVQLEILDAVCEVLSLQPGDIYRRIGAGEPSLTATAVELPGPKESEIVVEQKKVAKRTSANEWRSW